MKPIGRLVLAALAGILISPIPASASELVLKFAHEAPETAVKGQSAKHFAELVAKHTNGAVRVDVFPGGQLVPTTEEIRAVSRGQVDIIAPYSSYLSALDPAWDVFYQPMLFESPASAIKTFAGPVGQKLLERQASRGLKGLAIWHDGPVYAFAKGFTIAAPEDMKGRKVRVAPSKPIESMLQKVGATPVTMPATEVYLALQQGVAEAVVTTPTYAGPAKWHEVLNNGTRMMWGVGGYALVMNGKSFEKLTGAQREGFLKAVRETEQWNHEQALKAIAQAEAFLASNGMKLTDLAPAQREAWMAIAKKVWDEQGSEVKALIAEIEK